MKKRLLFLSLAIAVLSVSLTVGGIKGNVTDNRDLSVVNRNTYAASDTKESTETTTKNSILDDISNENENIDDFIGDKFDNASNVAGIFGDLGNMGGDILGGMDFGDAGNILGGLFGGTPQTTASQDSGNVVTTASTEPVNTVAPVYAATQQHQQVVVVTNPSVATTTKNANQLETVDFAATAVPYQKPATEIKGGDKGEGVKWMQWIFIYSQYGLSDDGITGVYDKDTIAVVKKLQKAKGMPVDGVVTKEVIEEIEKLYLASLGTVTVATTPAPSVAVTVPVVEKEEESPIAKVIFVFVVILWALVIAFIVTVIVIKKKAKKKAAAKKQSAASEESQNNSSDKKEETQNSVENKEGE